MLTLGLPMRRLWLLALMAQRAFRGSVGLEHVIPAWGSGAWEVWWSLAAEPSFGGQTAPDREPSPCCPPRQASVPLPCLSLPFPLIH